MGAITAASAKTTVQGTFANWYWNREKADVNHGRLLVGINWGNR